MCFSFSFYLFLFLFSLCLFDWADVNTGHVALRVVVYDKDAGVLDADDPLGGVIIELAEGTVLEEEYKLKNKPAKMKDGAQGTVRVRLSVVSSSAEGARAHCALAFVFLFV